MGAVAGDLLLIVAGKRAMVRDVLGTLRLDLGRPPVSEGGLRFVWVVDFPLFEETLGDDGRPAPMHHPFTMPHPDDIERLESDPLSVRAQAYDLVLNGWELGSGSVRIHRPDVQQRVLSLIGFDPAEAQQRFGFLLDAFRFGAPPHAGFAVGIDRFVAILAGEENIREVIAFPKTQSGVDPLTGAPTPIDPTQLRDLGLRLQPPTEPLTRFPYQQLGPKPGARHGFRFQQMGVSRGTYGSPDGGTGRTIRIRPCVATRTRHAGPTSRG